MQGMWLSGAFHWESHCTPVCNTWKGKVPMQGMRPPGNFKGSSPSTSAGTTWRENMSLPSMWFTVLFKFIMMKTIIHAWNVTTREVQREVSLNTTKQFMKYHCRECEYQAILKRKGPHANINGPSAFLRGGSGKGQIFMLKKMDAKLRDFWQ